MRARHFRRFCFAQQLRMRCLANGREPGRQVVVLLVRCVSGRAKAGRAAASSADLLSFLWPFLLLLLLLPLLLRWLLTVWLLARRKMGASATNRTTNMAVALCCLETAVRLWLADKWALPQMFSKQICIYFFTLHIISLTMPMAARL